MLEVDNHVIHETKTKTRSGSATVITQRRFIYDAFGRLVRTDTGDESPDVTRYRSNGLGFRIMWQDDYDADGTLESSERFYQAYDERWRPIGTFRDTDASPKEAFVWHAAGRGGFGDASYIDSVILRDRDNYTSSTPNPMNAAADGTLEERRYVCQNWRADVVAVTKSSGVPLEYVRYSSYGEPTVYPVADLDMDGDVNSSDQNAWIDLTAGGSSSAAYTTDIDFDGYYDIGGDDEGLFYESYAANTGLFGKGRVSSKSVANRIGYAGYQWDVVLRAYHVRYRVYLPEIGRWTRRDPLEYVDSANLYQYVQARSIVLVDPDGRYPGLVHRAKTITAIRGVGFTGFSGCTAAQAKHISDETNEMISRALDMYQELSDYEIANSPNSSSAGARTAARQATCIKAKVLAMLAALNKGIKVSCEDCGMVAESRTGIIYEDRIRICNNAFAPSPPLDLASFIFHELSHYGADTKDLDGKWGNPSSFRPQDACNDAYFFQDLDDARSIALRLDGAIQTPCDGGKKK